LEGFPLQAYDVFMLAVLVLATLFGLWKGMAWQLASLGSVVASLIVALRFGGAVAPYLSATAPWNRFLAMLILYLLTSLAVWLGFRLVAGALDRVKLQEFDRQVGALFGLAKGVLLCLVITFFAVTLSESTRQIVLKTYSGRYIALLIKKGAPVLPEEIRPVLGKYIDEFDRKLDPNTPPDEPAVPGLEKGLEKRPPRNQLGDERPPSPGRAAGPLDRPGADERTRRFPELFPSPDRT